MHNKSQQGPTRSLATVSGHLVNCAAYSPDGAFVLAAFLDCAARLWSLHKGERIHILIRCATFSADAAYVCTGAFDGVAKMWSVLKGECLRTFSGHDALVNSVAFSDEPRLAELLVLCCGSC
eukprot:Skav233016  [mRNA]  locus=scaffold909:126456:129980:+ [translate_table: standard]